MTTFKHFDLGLINPAFDSPLVDVLTELEHLRRLQLVGTTPITLFLQIKHVFHTLESLGSARIEGNHTTLADYVEMSLEGSHTQTDQLKEIANIEDAMAYVESTIEPGSALTEHFIRELHALTVRNLQREGDRTPGAYRSTQVAIAQSAHLPPEPLLVAGYMQDLVRFVNQADAPKYDLIKVALAHHRFGWVHPFGNGNGRVVRLLTYALLIKYGFNVKTGGRVLNPTAVFCSDRDQYYAMLSCADSGATADLEQWCVYVLRGILIELNKVDQLTDYKYLADKILIPALAYSRNRGWVSQDEEAVLRMAVFSRIAKAADLASTMPKLNETQRTYQIKKLVERKMLRPVSAGARKYTLGFDNNHLMRGVIHALSNEGFISAPLSGERS